ncbi:unnamed protein product [Peniophora sp. CBMAI 1063]|nr:unnamed protein product [Peniophora sp. CBMAI 1063]
MPPTKGATYGEIADTLLPSAVFTVDVLKTLSASVDSYVQLGSRDRRPFLQEQMEQVWPAAIDWTNRPRTHEFKAQWLALQRYFQEQGRVREPPTLPSSIAGRKWTGLRVCGVVYSDSIDEMVFMGTGMRPGDPRGYIGHRIKCRTVYYWKLPPEERKLLDTIAKDWQNGSLPVQQKTDAYYRRFQHFIKTVHLTALREFGQHMVTMAIPEPGLTNPPRLYEFMYDLKVLDRPLVKTVPVGDILTDIYLEVNHAAGKYQTVLSAPDISSKTGRIEGAALPTVLNKKSRLKRQTTWTLHEDDFLGHNGISLREEEFDEELFFKEAIAMVYMIVRMAHSNISKYRDLDPPWSSFHELVDSRYLLPDTPMCIPTTLRQPNCFLYLKHWFTVTKGLEFRLWQRKNSLPTKPVPMEERWWAASMPNRVQPAEPIPPTAQAAFDYIPSQPAPQGVAPRLSPYGSAGGHLVHGEQAREEETLETLGVAAVPDPEDLSPLNIGVFSSAVCRPSEDDPPCSVPANGEARAQWCLAQLRSQCAPPLRVSRQLRAAIKQVAEFPVRSLSSCQALGSHYVQMIPNASLSLKAAAKYTLLPNGLSWHMESVAPHFTADEMQTWLSFLQSEPWTISHGGSQLFAGSELIWTYILGWVVYLRGYSLAGGTGFGDAGAGLFTLGYAEFSGTFDAFAEAMTGYAEKYSYPGWAPSTKYAVVSSRSHYLAYLVRNEDYDVLLPLLKLVVALPDGPLEPPFSVVSHSAAADAPSWITTHYGVPSWQWQRCGLPPTTHSRADLPDLINGYLKRPDLLVSESTPRSCETALAVLLKVALIHADLEHIDDERWGEGGAAVLKHSTLRGHTRALRIAIADWANEQALLLEQLLPTETGTHAEDDAQSDEGQRRVMSPTAEMSEAACLQGALPHGVKEAGGNSMPEKLDPRYWAVELEDLGESHSVGQYQAWLAAQPRTAVQEVTRKGLEGLSQLEERRKANRAIRDAALQDAKRGHRQRKVPRPKRQAGAWEPMPEPGTTDDDEPAMHKPPRKRKKRMIIKKPRHVADGSKLVGPGRERTTKPASASAAHSVSTSRSVSPATGSRSFVAFPSPAAFDYGEDIEMPDRITSPSARPRTGAALGPITFDVQSTSSVMDVDSDDYGSARSVRPSHTRPVVFVQSEPAIFRSASTTPHPTDRDEAPTLSGGDLPLLPPRMAKRQARDDPLAFSSATASSAQDKPDYIRRSSRLRKTAA